MLTPYSWLTTPTLAEPFVAGSPRLPTAFLLRHGHAYVPRSLRLLTHHRLADAVRSRACRFYVAAVACDGEQIDLEWSYFFQPYFGPSLIVGSSLYARLTECCNLDDCTLIELDGRQVAAHVWPYRLPPDGRDDLLYARLLEELGLDEPPGAHELMRRLCECRPAPFELPTMHLIMPPVLLKRSWVWRQREGDYHTISLGQGAPGRAATRATGLKARRRAAGFRADAILRTPAGDVPLTREWMRRWPTLWYDGVLLPPAAAPAIDATETVRAQSLDYILDVTLEW